MRKFKCLLAVGARKTQADGRKENQQRAGNNQQKVNSPCSLCVLVELKIVLFLPVEKDLHCAVVRVPSPRLFTGLPLFGAK